MPLSTNPSFVAFAFTTAALSALLMILWALTGSARARTKTTPNVEDTSTVAKGAQLSVDEPDPVARMNRVYANALANTVPFLLLSFVWVVLGAPAETARIVFGVYVGARVVHALVYAMGKQPWRTVSFVVAQLATATTLVMVIRAAISAS